MKAAVSYVVSLSLAIGRFCSMNLPLRIWLGLATFGFVTTPNGFAWVPVTGHMMTKYAASVNPNSVWPEYPRPQLARSEWTNLNGFWDYAVTPDQANPPTHWEGQILVPFPLESSLSGICRPLRANQTLWYKRQFELSMPTNGQRVLLHFEAVNYITELMVNGKAVGQHQGGYDPF